MALPIPPHKLSSIISISKLEPESVNELVKVLENMQPSNDFEEILKYCNKKISRISSKELEDVVSILDDLYHIKELSSVDVDIFIEDIIDGTREGIEKAEESFEVNPNDLSSLEGKLQKLLNIGSLKVMAKARNLQRDAERRYCHTRILSDIRLVFDDDLKRKPAGAVILHILKLAYHINRGEHHEVFVTLDSEDLNQLKDTIDRAYEKSKTLEAFLGQANISDLSE
ncbi:MAG: hypothetical protein KDI61_08960 [Alphaproteobacteria bacterium]|nr:hypothetical protein [Alphaproteobacteria bacterium]